MAVKIGTVAKVKTTGAATAVLNAVDHPVAAMLLDPIHVDRSGGTAQDIAVVPRAWLPYSQFCDASANRPDPNDFDAVIIDAVDLRLQFGDGVLPLAAMLAALPNAIPLSIELRSKALRGGFPDARERSAAVAKATRAWLARSLPTW